MINIIAAAAKNGVIGSKGKIPWDIPEDRAYFREITTGGIVIMGRRTFEEIGSPLPDRFNIVVSKRNFYCGEGLITAGSLDEAIKLAEVYIKEKSPDAEIFLCGGEKIYTQGMKFAQRIYLTRLDNEYEGDVCFPEFSELVFRLIKSVRNKESGLSFNVYERFENEQLKQT